MNIMKSGEGLATVTDFINKKFGLDIPKKLKPLAISDLEKFREKYGVKDWSVIVTNQESQESTEQLSELLEIFTVDHTNFFRNKIHFDILPLFGDVICNNNILNAKLCAHAADITTT